MSLMASFCYCTERFFRGGDAEKQIVNGGDERGKFSLGFHLCEDVTAFPNGFDE